MLLFGRRQNAERVLSSFAFCVCDNERKNWTEETQAKKKILQFFFHRFFL
jgi:hypothetical protein